MALTRTEKAGAGTFADPPHWYLHAPLTGKPAAPDISALTVGEQAIISAWAAATDRGLRPTMEPIAAADGTPFSVGATAAVAAYLAYFATPEYVAWNHQNQLTRHAQWRLDLVDAIETAHANGTISISRDPAGSGAAQVASIGQSPAAAPVAAITSTGDWSITASTATITAATRTLTVPAGNSGNVRVSYVHTGATVVQYSKNGGAFTTVATNAILNVVTGDTLAFRVTGATADTEATGTLYDNDTGAAVGAIDIVHP